MKPAKSSKKKLLLPKVRKPMPPPTKVHKGKWAKLDSIDNLVHAEQDADYEDDPFKDNWLFT